MNRRALRRLAPFVAGGGFALAIAAVVISLVTTLGDNDKYGKVGVPGEGVVDLPAGDVILFYEARLGLPSDSSIDPPPGLEVRVRSRRSGEDVEREDASHLSSYQLGSLDGTSVYRLKVPEEGEYAVVARGAQGPESAVTFGPDANVGWVLGRSGLIILGGLLLGALMWRVGAGPRIPPAPAPATAHPLPEPDLAAELTELKRLRDSGRLTEAEYEARRSAALERL